MEDRSLPNIGPTRFQILLLLAHKNEPDSPKLIRSGLNRELPHSRELEVPYYG